jgi:uncharacterized protein
MMQREQILARLRAHEAELRQAGVTSLALFGSVARGEADAGSDVDVVIGLSDEAASGGFTYFGQIAALSERLQHIVGCPVDVVTEPVRKERLRHQIEREAVRAF